MSHAQESHTGGLRGIIELCFTVLSGMGTLVAVWALISPAYRIYPIIGALLILILACVYVSGRFGHGGVVGRGALIVAILILLSIVFIAVYKDVNSPPPLSDPLRYTLEVRAEEAETQEPVTSTYLKNIKIITIDDNDTRHRINIEDEATTIDLTHIKSVHITVCHVTSMIDVKRIKVATDQRLVLPIAYLMNVRTGSYPCR